MNRLIITILILIASLSASGQRIRFSDTTNVWRWVQYSCGGDEGVGSINYDHYIGDTVIHGSAYRILHYDYGTAFVREDTIAGKVYAIFTGWSNPSDTNEALLYDHNLHVGDTFRSPHAVHYVSAIDSVMISGNWYKIWDMMPYSQDSTIVGYMRIPYTVIEGIGCTASPLTPLYPFMFESCSALTCFNNNGVMPALSHKVGYYFDNTTYSCSLTFGVGVQDQSSESISVKVIPNPIDETGRLTFNHTIISGSLVIYNSLGQTVIDITFEHKSELLIGDKIKVPGMYYYRVTDADNGVSFSGKFIRQ